MGTLGKTISVDRSQKCNLHRHLGVGIRRTQPVPGAAAGSRGFVVRPPRGSAAARPAGGAIVPLPGLRSALLGGRRVKALLVAVNLQAELMPDWPGQERGRRG